MMNSPARGGRRVFYIENMEDVCSDLNSCMGGLLAPEINACIKSNFTHEHIHTCETVKGFESAREREREREKAKYRIR